MFIAAASNIAKDDPALLQFLLEESQRIRELLTPEGEISNFAEELKKAATLCGHKKILVFLENKIESLQEVMSVVSAATKQRLKLEEQLEANLEAAKQKYESNKNHADTSNYQDNLYHAYLDMVAFKLSPRGSCEEAFKYINTNVLKKKKGGVEALLVGSDKGMLGYILLGFIEIWKADECQPLAEQEEQKTYQQSATYYFNKAAELLDNATHPLLCIGQAVLLASKGELKEAIKLKNCVKELLEEGSIWIERGSISEELCNHKIALIDLEEQKVIELEERKKAEKREQQRQQYKDLSNTEIERLIKEARKKRSKLFDNRIAAKRDSGEKPSCFVVYAHHEPDEHGSLHRNVAMVRQLITDLERNGIDVKSDRGKGYPLEGIRAHSARYIEPESEDAVDYVIVALSEQLVLKADKEDPVLHEELLMVDERLDKNGRASVILVQLDAVAENELHKVCPDIFKTRGRGLKFAVDHLIIKDFITDDGYAKGLHTLYGALHGKREKELPLVSMDVMGEASPSQKTNPIDIIMSLPSSIPEEVTGESSQVALNRKEGKEKVRA